MVCSLLKVGTTNASYDYDEEVFLPVGAYFKIEVNSDVHYTVVDGDAKVVLSKSGKEVYCYKLGQVLLQASYYINGDHKLPYQIKYLINVLPMDVYQSGQRNNFETMRQKRDDVYFESKEEYAQNILMLVNKERSKFGISPLRLAKDLQDGANIRAKELTVLYDHTRPDGSPCYTVLSRKGRGAGENIAAGQRTEEAVMRDWMSSPGHRNNILNPNFRELGVGYTFKENDSNRYNHYWVQLFRG